MSRVPVDARTSIVCNDGRSGYPASRFYPMRLDSPTDVGILSDQRTQSSESESQVSSIRVLE